MYTGFDGVADTQDGGVHPDASGEHKIAAKWYAALAPMGPRAQVADSIDTLVAQVTAVARPGDHILCMSNGGFGGVHAKLLDAIRNP